MLLLVCAVALAWAPESTAQTMDGSTDVRTLGRLEQESVDDAAAVLGLTVDPQPTGKRVGRVLVVTQEVFSRRDWHFQLLNAFHRTTRPNVVARELLIKSGDLYDAGLVDESIRNLQAPPPLVVGSRSIYVPEWASVVAILPVRSLKPGEVDLLVVTRDVWSLRFNTAFEFQQNTVAYLATSLSENNLFGWRKYLAANFVMDQGAMGFGPTYFDPNVLGTRLTLYATATTWYGRSDQSHEGSSATWSVRYPLYALSRRWGGGLDLIHSDVVVRRFRGNDLWQEEVVGLEMGVPHIYRRRTASLDGHVVRSFPTARLIQRVTGGVLVDARDTSLVPPNLGLDAATAQQFLEDVAPIPETRSEPYMKYDLFTPRYGVFRDLDTFDLRENRRLGPSLSVRLGYSVPQLGSDFAALSLRATFAAAARWGSGYGQVAATVAGRWRRGDLFDQYLNCAVLSATPVLNGWFRIVVHAELNAVRDDTYRTLFFIGGQTGLRGHIIGDFKGPVSAVGHLELRTLPLAVFSQRIGALLFYDVGHAAESIRYLRARHDFGVGLRWLIPQLNSSVLRVDWAFATRTTVELSAANPGFVTTRAGWPGRISAGYEQVF